MIKNQKLLKSLCQNNQFPQNGKGTLGNDLKWNFTKFLIDQKGLVVCREGTTTCSDKLAPKIEKLFPTPF